MYDVMDVIFTFINISMAPNVGHKTYLNYMEKI